MSQRQYFAALIVGALIIVCLADGAWAADDCSPEAVRSAFETRDANALDATFRKTGTSCETRVTMCAGRLEAILLVDKAEQAKDDAAAQNLIDEAIHLGAPWQAESARGDIAFDKASKGEKDAYSTAASAYESALNDLTEPTCKAFGEPNPPPMAEIAGLYKRMTEAKLLAPSFEVTRKRDGQCGGVFLTNIRGFTPKSTPLPIEFEYDTASLTQKGEKAAQGLLDCVANRNFSAIRLTGHTDHVGSDPYNMDLSAKRLDAIKALLLAEGYKGTIELVPLGKRQPFAVDDPEKYTQSEIDQMNRRVELKDAQQ